LSPADRVVREEEPEQPKRAWQLVKVLVGVEAAGMLWLCSAVYQAWGMDWAGLLGPKRRSKRENGSQWLARRDSSL
jgi:hypothetical protein